MANSCSCGWKIFGQFLTATLAAQEVEFLTLRIAQMPMAQLKVEHVEGVIAKSMEVAGVATGQACSR